MLQATEEQVDTVAVSLHNKELLRQLFPLMMPCLNCAQPLDLKEVIPLLEKARVKEVHLDTLYGDYHPHCFSLYEINELLDYLPMSADIHLWPSLRMPLQMELKVRSNDLLSIHISSNLQHKADRIYGEHTLKDCRVGCVISSDYDFLPYDISCRYYDRITVLAIPIGSRRIPLNQRAIQLASILLELRKEQVYRFEVALDGGINFETLSMVETLCLDHFVVGSILFGHPPSLTTLIERLDWLEL